jgi:oxygen-independent coproporphyrinogen III oxidase
VHLYLHIPFCRQACHYCDFHFSTSQNNRRELIEAMMQELDRRKSELPAVPLTTIYFGGGTPSLLSAEELNFVFEKINSCFSISENAEITLEANPDDLTASYLQILKQSPINRLSIGIQSFRDADLKWMNRAHTAAEAKAAVKRAQEVGITNITVDLIYGIPGLSLNDWNQNLEEVRQLNVQHLSCYCLTIEPKTALAKFVASGKSNPVDEVLASAHFMSLLEFAKQNGYEQYEISNFAKADFIARHNTSYWFGEAYLGIGPSAHSYDGKSRRWNVSNNAMYVKKVAQDEMAFEEERLTERDRFNEYVMTRLRTKWGIRLNEIQQEFGETTAHELLQNVQVWLESGDMICNENTFVLTEKGRLLADRIAGDLFV